MDEHGDDALIAELRRRGYFVSRLKRAPDHPPGAIYRPYFSVVEIFSPWASCPIIRETVARLLACGRRTAVPEPRQWTLLAGLRQVASVAGEVWEAGVFQGGTAYLLRRAIEELGIADATRLRLFDTFGGMPKTDPRRDRHREGDFAETSLDAVRELVGDEPFITYHRGLVPESFAGLEEAQLRFAHIDLDVYDSVRRCIEFVHPRLARGGIAVFDDYGFPSCPGAREAVDEFFARQIESPIYLATGQALVIKL